MSNRVETPKEKEKSVLQNVLPKNKPWGNLLANTTSAWGGTRKSKRALMNPPPPPAPTAEDLALKEENEEMLDSYKVPNLVLRSDIYDNFPVVGREIELEKDKIQRFALEWSRKDYYPFRANQAKEDDHYTNYAYYTVWRLIYSLRKRSDLYSIEPPRSENEICVLVMDAPLSSEEVIRSTKLFMLSRGVNIPPVPREPRGYNDAPQPQVKPMLISTAGHTPHAAHPHAEAPRAAHPHAAGPVFHSLNELKAEFPIVWSHDRTRNLYLLDIFGKKVKEHAERRAGRPLRYDAPEVLDARRRVEHALRAALVASPAWTFYEPKEANSAHFAVLAMHGPHRG